MTPMSGSTKPRILVIEDEPTIADAVAARLRSADFSVEIAADGPAGVAACAERRPDLVVLDLMLPGLDGLEVCRRIQADRPVPVLMLTARDTEDDLVEGLATGADDYLTKPFSGRELVARVRALLRRTLDGSGAGSGAGVGSGNVGELTLGPWRIDRGARTVTDGVRECHLTPTEFDLLVHFATRPGQVCTREDLLAEVWGYRDGSGARTVDSHVRALRRKLGAEAIRTVHGVGYAAARPVDGAAA